MQLICQLDAGTGAMPVRWCLDEDDHAKIVQNEVVNPHMLIDVYYREGGNHTRERIVVPLETTMQFVAFRRPGLAYVCAAIVYPKKPTAESLKRMLHTLKSRSEGVFDREIFHVDRAAQRVNLGYDARNEHYAVVSYTHHQVEVPEEYFAKPYTGWLKDWVELVPRKMLRRKLVDQCDQRRWAWFAFTLQPFFVLPILAAMAMLLAIVTLVAAVRVTYMWLWRGYFIIWKEVLPGDNFDAHPWYTDRSFYTHTQNGTWRPWWQQLLQPAGLCMVAGPFLMFHGFATLQVLQASIRFNVTLPIGLLLLMFGTLGMLRTLKHWMFLWQVRSKKAVVAKTIPQSELETLRQHAAHTAIELSCPIDVLHGMQHPRDLLRVSALPPKHRTLQLQFQALKAQICKPLSQ